MAINYALAAMLLFVVLRGRGRKFHFIMGINVFTFAMMDYLLIEAAGLIDIFTLFVNVDPAYVSAMKSSFNPAERPFIETYYLICSIHMLIFSLIYLTMRGYIPKMAFLVSAVNCLVNLVMIPLSDTFYHHIHSATGDILVTIEIFLAWIAARVKGLRHER